MKSIYYRFKSLLIEGNLIKEGDKILLGASGGSDSIALLELFLDLKKEFPLSIGVAHVNYGLRGIDSNLDEELILNRCEKEQISCHFFKVNNEILEKAEGSGLEEKARNIRYAYFKEIKCTHGYSKVAIAHTKDDIIETLLFNLIRGTSPEKFSKVLPLYDEKNEILRPLIEFSKEELLEYNKSKGAEFRLDLSNKEIIFSRNRLRHKIIPEIKEINPSFENSLLKFREILRIEEDFIDREINILFDGENIVKIDDSFLILKNFYISLHDALKLRLIRKIREIIAGTLKDFYYSEILYIKDGILKTDNFKYSNRFIRVYIKGSWIIIEGKKVLKMNEETEYEIKKILFTKEQIDKRVEELAEEINSFYKGNLYIIGILKGAFVFLADLIRQLDSTVKVDFIEVSSYGTNTESFGNITMGKDIKMDIKGRDVLLVEDIVDSGYTIAFLKEELRKRNPKSISICSFLDKPSRRKVPLNLDFCGFSIPDAFVVGYGMDVNEQFRNLPFIAIVDKVSKKEL